jgi:solute carrier family 25 (mitochondrial phosphate transporter), member 23/24/25/41
MTPTRRLICGGIAGITSVTVTYPLDIVRTRLSIQSASFAGLGSRDPSQKLPGMFTTMVSIYKNEGGIIALYRGIVPTVAGVAPYVCFPHNLVLQVRSLMPVRWGLIS